MNSTEAPLPSGDHLVCPRCGAPAGDDVFCDACGLNLKQQQLVTADSFAAAQREKKWLAERTAEDQQAKAAKRADQQQQRQQRAAEQEQRRAQKRTEREDSQKAARLRRHERREQWQPRIKRTAIVLGAFMVLLAGAAVAWHLTGWDAPLIGTSQIGDGETGESTDVVTTPVSSGAADEVDDASANGAATPAGSPDAGVDQTEVDADTRSQCSPVPGVGLNGSDVTNLMAEGVSCDVASDVVTSFFKDEDAVFQGPVTVDQFECLIGPMTEGYPSECSGVNDERITFSLG